MLYLKKITFCLLYFFLFVFVGSFSWVLTYKFINPPRTYLMDLRKKQAVKNHQELEIKQEWVRQDKISKHLKEAIIFAEDTNFYNHRGVVWDKFFLAYKMHNLHKKGRQIFGFSTITQQTAKNVFLYPSRTPLRKALELYFTVLMEVVWGKERILEIYLNTIELGPGVFGVEAGSKAYFKKSSSDISVQEGYWLASIMPHPIKLSKNRRIVNPLLKMRADALSSAL
jgi:monofunctional biosynthetic peptidoglycan transglycosylase